MKTKIFGLFALLFIVSCSNEEESLSTADYSLQISQFVESRRVEMELNDKSFAETKGQQIDENRASFINNCNDPITYYLRIFWTNPAISNSEKEIVRVYFENNLGKDPTELILPDGSEVWVFNTNNITIPLNGNCRTGVIIGEVNNHNDVDTEGDD